MWLTYLLPSGSSIENCNLCGTCRCITQGRRKDKSLGVTATHLFAQTTQELALSAEHGCHLCYIRWQDLTIDDRKALEGCSKVTFGFWQSSVGDGVAFEYVYPKLPKEGKPCLMKSLRIKSKAEVAQETPGMVSRATDEGIASPTVNKRSFNLARNWISNYSEAHAFCNRSLPLPQN